MAWDFFFSSLPYLDYIIPLIEWYVNTFLEKSGENFPLFFGMMEAGGDIVTERQVDWDLLKGEYATQDISLRQIAAKYHLSPYTVRRRSAADGWVSAREQYRTELAQEMLQQASKAAGRSRAQSLIKLQHAADQMVDVVEACFQDATQFYRYIVTQKRGFDSDEIEKEYGKLDTKAVKDLTGAMRDLAAVVRDLYGIPTLPQQSAMDLAAERLKLDQRKADEAAHKDDAAEIRVVMDNPALEEYSS